jgi:hypothetical protein
MANEKKVNVFSIQSLGSQKPRDHQKNGDCPSSTPRQPAKQLGHYSVALLCQGSVCRQVVSDNHLRSHPLQDADEGRRGLQLIQVIDLWWL